MTINEMSEQTMSVRVHRVADWLGLPVTDPRVVVRGPWKQFEHPPELPRVGDPLDD